MKRQKSFFTFIFFLLGMALSSCASTQKLYSLQTKVKELNDRFQTLDQKIRSLDQSLTALKSIAQNHHDKDEDQKKRIATFENKNPAKPNPTVIDNLDARISALENILRDIKGQPLTYDKLSQTIRQVELTKEDVAAVNSRLANWRK